MQQKLPETLTFVDIETTGTSPTIDRIIEIGILRVENNKLTKTYNQLINPEKPVSPFISQMTGITPDVLERAPSFSQVKDEILELLQGSTFVAHNVRFDYGFIRQEFLRIGKKVSLPHFCTVRLFRSLVPGRKRYNLDELIAHFGISCENRHRAFDDAQVLWEFYQIGKKTTNITDFINAISYALKRPSVPDLLESNAIDDLPEAPGVYIFRAKDEAPLYIGKSTNIKERVMSHFTADYKSGIEMKMKQQIARIETRQTAGELGALLLESELIKQEQPIYNRLLRYRRRLIVAKEKFNNDNYKTVHWETVSTIDPQSAEEILGIFKSEKQLKTTLDELAHQHTLCPKLLGLEKGSGPCFSSQLHGCRGACTGKELAARYNMRFVEAFSKFKLKRWPFSGPIVVKEQGEAHHEGYVLNHWCLLGKAHWDDLEAMSYRDYEYTFDVDVYKILVRYLMNPYHLKQIHVLPSN